MTFLEQERAALGLSAKVRLGTPTHTKGCSCVSLLIETVVTRTEQSLRFERGNTARKKEAGQPAVLRNLRGSVSRRAFEKPRRLTISGVTANRLKPYSGLHNHRTPSY